MGTRPNGKAIPDRGLDGRVRPAVFFTPYLTDRFFRINPDSAELLENAGAITVADLLRLPYAIADPAALRVRGKPKQTRKLGTAIRVFADRFLAELAVYPPTSLLAAVDKTELPPLSAEAEIALGQRVTRALTSLKDPEKAVITERFGLLTGYGVTLKQIGERIGVDQEQVRQILVAAATKLRSLALLGQTAAEFRPFNNQSIATFLNLQYGYQYVQKRESRLVRSRAFSDAVVTEFIEKGYLGDRRTQYIDMVDLIAKEPHIFSKEAIAEIMQAARGEH